MGILVWGFVIWFFIGMVLSYEDYCRNKRNDYDDDDY